MLDWRPRAQSVARPPMASADAMIPFLLEWMFSGIGNSVSSLESRHIDETGRSHAGIGT